MPEAFLVTHESHKLWQCFLREVIGKIFSKTGARREAGSWQSRVEDNDEKTTILFKKS